MSNFKGWSMASIEALKLQNNTKSNSNIKNIADKQKRKANKESEDMIAEVLTQAGFDFVREYKFLKDRRFKFDFALPHYQIAIEFEGGIFTKGRHTRGKGYANDVKKYNLATMHGWKLLRYTIIDLEEENWQEKIINEINQVINKGKP